MKEFFMNIQKPFLIASAALVFFAIIQSKDANKYIDAENESNHADYRKPKLPRASEGMLMVVFALLVILLIGAYFFA